MKQTPVVANNTGYIDKKALLDEFEKWNFGKHGQLEKYFADRAFAIIDKVPTADVVEVVRCKDCIHRFKDTNGDYCCNLDDNYAVDTGFCSYGERR